MCKDCEEIQNKWKNFRSKHVIYTGEQDLCPKCDREKVVKEHKLACKSEFRAMYH